MIDKAAYRHLLAAAAACTLFATAAAAQQRVIVGSQQKSVRIVRASTPPVIDGVLDDAVWTEAAVVDDLHEIQPNEYDEPSEPTIVYLLYDDDALYVGARLFDRDPDQVTARILRQGEQVFGDDWFSLIIDPFNDKRSGYRFLTNPNGLRQEGLFENVSDTQWNWQGIWYAAGSINDEGWVAEIAIPYKSIAFDPNNDTWGINFRRAIARRDERTGWVSRNRNSDPSTSGIAVGFEGQNQGVGLDIVPSASLIQRKQFATGDTAITSTRSESSFEPSLDLFYKLTPGLTTALTVNTDFSATEIDDRQVNLDRFDLFFPEKRDFFLQDADIFEFGGLSENGRPFFSRTIGISDTGNEVDLEVGGKLSGRLGRFNLGALAIRQDRFGDTVADNAIVARASANVLRESTVGFIATEGDPHSNLDNSLTGMDFFYRNTRLPGGRFAESNIWFQQSDTEGLDGDDSAYGIRIATPTATGFRAETRYTRIGENFNPALGFVNRRGIEQWNFGTNYRWRPAEGMLRTIDFGMNGERVTSLATGIHESQELRLNLLELEGRQGDEIELRHFRNREILPVDFEISDGIVLPVGNYPFDRTSFEIQTADQRRISGGIDVAWGEFYSGSRDMYRVNVTWRPSGRLRTYLSYEYNDITLPEGAFETRLAQFRADVAFSSTLSWVTLLQYDNVSEIVGVNSRVHWIPEAGREAFLVLNHSLQDFDRDNRFDSYLSDTSIKFTYTFRY